MGGLQWHDAVPREPGKTEPGKEEKLIVCRRFLYDDAVVGEGGGIDYRVEGLPETLDFDESTQRISGTFDEEPDVSVLANFYECTYRGLAATHSDELGFIIKHATDTPRIFSNAVVSNFAVEVDASMLPHRLPPGEGLNCSYVHRSVEGLPPGLSFDAETYEISGVPTQTGRYLCKYRAAEWQWQGDELQFYIYVRELDDNGTLSSGNLFGSQMLRNFLVVGTGEIGELGMPLGEVPGLERVLSPWSQPSILRKYQRPGHLVTIRTITNGTQTPTIPQLPSNARYNIDTMTLTRGNGFVLGTPAGYERTQHQLWEASRWFEETETVTLEDWGELRLVDRQMVVGWLYQTINKGDDHLPAVPDDADAWSTNVSRSPIDTPIPEGWAADNPMPNSFQSNASVLCRFEKISAELRQH